MATHVGSMPQNSIDAQNSVLNDMEFLHSITWNYRTVISVMGARMGISPLYWLCVRGFPLDIATIFCFLTSIMYKYGWSIYSRMMAIPYLSCLKSIIFMGIFPRKDDNLLLLDLSYLAKKGEFPPRWIALFNS